MDGGEARTEYAGGEGAEIFGVFVPKGSYTVQQLADLVNASPHRKCDVRVTERGALQMLLPKPVAGSVSITVDPDA